MDEPALGVLEWWRVVDVDREVGRRMLFIEQEPAEEFARYLLSEASTYVHLEHWCDEGLVGMRLLVSAEQN